MIKEKMTTLTTLIDLCLKVLSLVAGYLISLGAMYLGCSVGMKIAKMIYFWFPH